MGNSDGTMMKGDRGESERRSIGAEIAINQPNLSVKFKYLLILLKFVLNYNLINISLLKKIVLVIILK